MQIKAHRHSLYYYRRSTRSIPTWELFADSQGIAIRAETTLAMMSICQPFLSPPLSSVTGIKDRKKSGHWPHSISSSSS